ncbi:hypothetical protein HH310_10020 [Actinoplanes sp. TBRC 11911]|uniref:SCO2522 family protein n=1 Tax=Actinoplanes sp. TBRC 11911 TaxID=2729386 RepID=UPI00145C5FD8|nr:SCO2522 family protein [Actinoplanes sp. TBRC 11911]NMO51525.1 hypothetical protein [Actinoplanes sp. TBRC 11911]
MTDVFTEESALPGVRSVALSHLSLELGHLYVEDFDLGEARLREHFRKVAPWAEAVRREVAAELPAGRRPRVSTCFLIDDYFTKFSTPREVVASLVSAAAEAGLTIDYVARESGCARADGIDLATLVQQHLAEEPPEGSTGRRPPTSVTGWLSNGERTPVTTAAAMEARSQWRPPRQSAVRHHSIFVDIELWSDGPEGRLWSCPFLAAVWQLQRLGLLRHQGDPIAEPATVGEMPSDWDAMPPIVQLSPSAAPMRAYRTFSPLDGRFLPVELAVRTILTQVAIDPLVLDDIAARAGNEGVAFARETVDRVGYAFV